MSIKRSYSDGYSGQSGPPLKRVNSTASEPLDEKEDDAAHYHLRMQNKMLCYEVRAIKQNAQAVRHEHMALQQNYQNLQSLLSKITRSWSQLNSDASLLLQALTLGGRGSGSSSSGSVIGADTGAGAGLGATVTLPSHNVLLADSMYLQAPSSGAAGAGAGAQYADFDPTDVTSVTRVSACVCYICVCICIWICICVGICGYLCWSAYTRVWV